ncbi:hypothetical protein FNYG_02976 [Fusarium nygamai]|uniref:Uncharacterized protein n=1 Tax=Gibberella nygamai TaxID=42673 RepID=A0A2K0WMB8_GIBNY|nr:hypothetical protein FNYG_02976 [Fusarium nygamai]
MRAMRSPLPIPLLIPSKYPVTRSPRVRNLDAVCAPSASASELPMPYQFASGFSLSVHAASIVGAPEPTALEAEAGAPTLDTATAPSEPAKPEESKPTEGAGGLSAPPKPVEVASVPETPVNNMTPAGGTPRPVLNLEEEPKETPKNEDENAFITDAPTSAPAVSAPKDVPMTDNAADDKPAGINGAGKPEVNDVAEAAAGEKRKAGEPPAATNGASDPAVAEKSESEERAEKKARVEDVADEPTATENTSPNGKHENGKAAKKDKKATPVAGKTARKTRSQGPVEV